MNHLNAVFWDYPKFTNSDILRTTVRDRKNRETRLWILKRFLEYGRVVDTWQYFDLSEIAAELPGLKLSASAYQKWKRIIEVYGKSERR